MTKRHVIDLKMIGNDEIVDNIDKVVDQFQNFHIYSIKLTMIIHLLSSLRVTVKKT